MKRIEAKGGGDCEPYYFDLLACADKCVSGQVLEPNPLGLSSVLVFVRAVAGLPARLLQAG